MSKKNPGFDGRPSQSAANFASRPVTAKRAPQARASKSKGKASSVVPPQAPSLVVTPQTQASGDGASNGTITAVLVHRPRTIGSSVPYAQPGIRASVYFSKGMFTGTPPRSIMLSAPGLAVPDGSRAAERAAKAAERAQKAKARADKAIAEARKATALVGGAEVVQ